MLDYIKKLITPDMVSLWVPSGQNRAIDLIRGNHGQCYGTHPNVPVISPPIDQINACDAVTGWATATGGSLSIDTVDKKEGTGSLKNTIAVPLVDAYYYTYYTKPSGSWDWSNKKDALLWLKCDRASTAFATPRLQIYDTLDNYRAWNLTFSAGEWTAVKKLLSTGDVQSATPPNMSLINRVYVTVQAKDDTPFYLKVDDIRVTGKPSLINPSVGWVFGGDDYITIPEMTISKDSGAITFWVYSTADFYGNYEHRGEVVGLRLGGTHKLLALYDDGSGDYGLHGETNLNGEYFIQVNNVVPRGQWHCLEVSFDSGVATTYINTVQVDQQSGLTADWTFNGMGGSETSFFNGLLALPSVSRKPRSQAQVNNFYLHTKGLFAPRG